jgi:hypothetical protein
MIDAILLEHNPIRRGPFMEDLFRLSQTQLTLFNRPYRRYFLQEHNLDRPLGVIVGQRGS